MLPVTNFTTLDYTDVYNPKPEGRFENAASLSVIWEKRITELDPFKRFQNFQFFCTWLKLQLEFVKSVFLGIYFLNVLHIEIHMAVSCYTWKASHKYFTRTFVYLIMVATYLRLQNFHFVYLSNAWGAYVVTVKLLKKNIVGYKIWWKNLGLIENNLLRQFLIL